MEKSCPPYPADTLLVFNPEHDLALANGQPHFVPPSNAVVFAREAAIIPIWIYGRGTVVSEPIPKDYSQILQSLNIDIQIVNRNSIQPSHIKRIIPWGWDLLLTESLKKLGFEKNILLSESEIKKIKELSNRQLAIKANNEIAKSWNFPLSLPNTAKFVTQTTLAEDFIAKNRNMIMKMPWSGSGKGLRFCREKLTTHDKGWLKNVIEKQGGAVLEKRYSVVQDFALEFYCCNGKVEFCGYSLFFTQNGAYQGNHLLSNQTIPSKLSTYVSKEYIIFCKDFYKTFLEKEVAPYYTGFVGVDMFIYHEGNEYRLHPACEINLRTTMGLLARKITDNYINQNSEGMLLTAYSDKIGELAHILEDKKSSNPLRISNGKITSGIVPLFPVNDFSHYAIWTEIKTI